MMKTINCLYMFPPKYDSNIYLEGSVAVFLLCSRVVFKYVDRLFDEIDKQFRNIEEKVRKRVGHWTEPAASAYTRSSAAGVLVSR